MDNMVKRTTVFMHVQVDPHKSTLLHSGQKTFKIQDLHTSQPPLYTVFQVVWLMQLTAPHMMQQCGKSAYTAMSLTLIITAR